MKRVIVIILSIAVCLIGCGKQNVDTDTVSDTASGSSTTICWSERPACAWSVTDTITISLPQDTYPAGTNSFTVTLTNTGDQTMLYGESYSFQYNDGSGWNELETIENYGFHMIGYLLGPGQTQTLEISPWMLTAPLPVGRCQIVGCSLRVADGEDQLAYGGNYTEYEPYRLEFDIVNAPYIPETTEMTVEDTAFWLEIRQTEEHAENLVFTIYNESGRDAEILLIPELERKTADGGWEAVPFLETVGFCGTPDPLPSGTKEWSVETEPLWGMLEPGEYRLSYKVTDVDGNEFSAIGTFLVGDTLCGYPTADQFG